MCRNRRGVDEGTWGIIILVGGILFVIAWLKGPQAISKWAHAFGRARGEFDKGKAEIDSELSQLKKSFDVKGH